MPRACKDAESSFKSDAGALAVGGGGGVCMFNFECTRLGGTVVGSCVDVFLFGACCRLPAGTKLPNVIEQPTNGAQGPGGVVQQSTYATAVDQQDPPSFQPVADTILLHRNGSAVHNAYGPDDMSADLLANFTAVAHHHAPDDGMADVLVHRYTDRPDSAYRPFANKVTIKVDGAKQTSSPVSKSTDSVPNIRKTTPSLAHVQATTSKQGVHYRPHVDDEYDNMVLIPTLTVHDPNKAPMENNSSIHHILSILNNQLPQMHATDPVSAAESVTVQQYHTTSSPAALYTWGSIEGDSKSPNYGSALPSTRPTPVAAHHHQQHYDRPAAAAYYGASTTASSTSTHHLPGPHFHVTTGRPEPAAPTVIVLNAADPNKNQHKYSSTAALYATSTRPSPSSHVKPSQSIVVTGKPSVSAAYTTTATYHHHQQQQQQQQQHTAFVPVGSTQSDAYYQTTVHTSAKPVMSSSKPTTSSYGKPPPTLSGTVHQHDAINNNVFTTVITSVNHHKYQQPTTNVATSSTYSTAKPVLNNEAVAVISTSTGAGYRPHHVSVADEDYPTPVVTPATQVFITASDVHHHTSSVSSYPVTADDPVFNSTDTFAFPPVRDPYVNLTASQQEKPAVIGGDYDADAEPNPQLTTDENLDDKVHLFVEKVVQSLQGNFEDLEKVLLSGDTSSANVTVANDSQDWPPNKKPTTTTTTKKPPKPGKPGKPTKVPTSTYRPTPITLPLDSVPYLEVTTTARPTKIPTLLTPVQLFQPTTYTSDYNKRPKPTKVPSTTVVLDALNVEHDHTTAEPDYRKGTWRSFSL